MKRERPVGLPLCAMVKARKRKRDTRTRIEDPRIARLIYGPDDVSTQRQDPAQERARAQYQEPLGTLTLTALGASLRWSAPTYGVGGLRWSIPCLPRLLCFLSLRSPLQP